MPVRYYENRTWHCWRIDTQILQVSGDSVWKRCHYPKYAPAQPFLKEVILDHRPVTSFWCFSFERFNGILGSTTTNKRSVELQIMRKFLLTRFLKDMKLPEEFQGNFLKFCSPEENSTDDKDVSPYDWPTAYEFFNIATNAPLRGINWLNKSGINVSSCYKLVSFDADDLKLLTTVYKVMYPERQIETNHLAETICKFGSLKIWSTTYESKMQPRGIRSAKTWASWPEGNGQVLQESFLLSPGIVQYYFTHSIKLGDEYVSHHCACVRWFLAHEESYFANPIKTYKNKFLPGGPASFMPLQWVFSRFASAELEMEGQQTIAVAQITRNVYLQKYQTQALTVISATKSTRALNIQVQI